MRVLVRGLQVFLLVGLMLLGWGLGHMREFFANADRLIFLALALAFVILSPDASRTLVDAKQPDSLRSSSIVPLSQLVILILRWFLPFADRRSVLTFHDEMFRTAGLGFFALGSAIQCHAMYRLGRHYSPFVILQRGHELVQGGIYGWIRHPIYLGLLLSFSGTALVFRSWLAIPIFLSTALFITRRIRQEEKLLREEFGLEFATYLGRTKKLIPYVF